jgi:competence protein ComEC
MILLYLSIAYMLGVAGGHLWWQAGGMGCGWPGWAWILALLPVPGLIWWERRPTAPSIVPMIWPRSAGFLPVRPALSQTILAAILLCLTAGILRYASHPAQPCWTPGDLAYYNEVSEGFTSGAPVTLVGMVGNYPTVKEGRQELHIQVTALETAGQRHLVTGKARLTTSPRTRYSYGQPVSVSGGLVEPPVFEGFDYRAYLVRRGIHSLVQRPQIEVLPGSNQGHPLLRTLYSLRARGEQILNRSLPEPYAALANGMLLGIESGIPGDLYDQFNLTGTSHVIVISGSNVAIVAGVLMALGVRLLGRRRALWPTLAGIGLYALLVGGDSAVVRASIMGGLFVIATTSRRQSTALISLAAACWVMTLLNPLTLWDVGFQLSSAATAGLILFSPGLTAWLNQLWPGFGQGGHLTGGGTLPQQAGQASAGLLRGLVQDGLLITLAANFTTLPLVVYYFDRLSLVSPLTNLLIAPAQPFIMLWGGGGVILGLMGLSWLAQAALWVPFLSLAWTVAMVQGTAALPGASLLIPDYGLGWLGLTYLILAGARWQGWIRERLQAWRDRLGLAEPPPPPTSTLLASSAQKEPGRGMWLLGRVTGGASLLGLGVGIFLLARIVLSGPDGRLHVHFLDIGQGDGIFIQTPSGRQILVDGGMEPQTLLAELGRVMPFWDRDIDLLILSHPDLDHMGGQLGITERLGIGQAVASPVTWSDASGQGWLDVMAAAGVPVSVQTAGGWIDLGDGVSLWTLWPLSPEQMGRTAIPSDDRNEQSLVQKLVYGEFEVLLTGDAGVDVERWMLAQGAPLYADVLKAGHHGSRNSTGPPFVAQVNPSVAVIQVGENRYGHPHQDVLDVLAGRVILRNDDHGWVHIWTDGAHMWLRTQQGEIPLPDQGLSQLP